MARQPRPTDVLKLRKKRYGIGIAWDQVGVKIVDLDLQAVIVDDSGVIMDAVYYNNLSCMSGAISHGGDTEHGDAEGVDESIWVSLDRLPKQVALIIFIIAAYDDGCLADGDNGKLVIMQDCVGHSIREIKLESSHADVDIVAMMKRTESSWELHEIDSPSVYGAHFLDILEPSIGDLIRKHIQNAPLSQKAAFVMKKGHKTDLPQDDKLQRLAVGIGGSLPMGVTLVVDIDISIVFYSKDGNVEGAVDRDTLELFGVRHTGDEHAGANAHSRLDDEAVRMDMKQVPKEIAQIFFIMTCKSGTFARVDQLYARVVDQCGTEVARFQIAAGVRQNGLAIARLYRAPGLRWGFQALGKFLRGKDWRACQSDMLAIFREKPQDVRGKRQMLKSKANQSMESVASFRLRASDKSDGGDAAAACAGAPDAAAALAAQDGEAEMLPADSEGPEDMEQICVPPDPDAAVPFIRQRSTSFVSNGTLTLGVKVEVEAPSLQPAEEPAEPAEPAGAAVEPKAPVTVVRALSKLASSDEIQVRDDDVSDARSFPCTRSCCLCSVEAQRG